MRYTYDMSAKKRLVVLDTHAILHRAYHALPDFSSSSGMPTGALYGLLSMLVKIINDLRPDYIAAAVDLPEDALLMQMQRTPGVVGAFGLPVYSCEGF